MPEVRQNDVVTAKELEMALQKLEQTFGRAVIEALISEFETNGIRMSEGSYSWNEVQSALSKLFPSSTSDLFGYLIRQAIHGNSG
jgi:hypothetical protein